MVRAMSRGIEPLVTFCTASWTICTVAADAFDFTSANLYTTRPSHLQPPAPASGIVPAPPLSAMRRKVSREKRVSGTFFGSATKVFREKVLGTNLAARSS